MTANSDPAAMFNRYRYAYSNPYKFTDPDGRCPMPGSSLCGKSFETIVAQSGHSEDFGPLPTGPVSGSGWSRPASHPYVVGRAGTIVSPGPGRGLGKTLEGKIPAMHTMGTLHDSIVDSATKKGLPDLLVNIPTMPFAYGQSVVMESTNSSVNVINRVLGTSMPKPFEHTHNQSSSDQSNQLAKGGGFQGEFRVEGRLDSKRLDNQLKGK